MMVSLTDLLLVMIVFTSCKQFISCSTCYRATYCGYWGSARHIYRYCKQAYCCPGWTGTGCAYAFCDGKTNLNGACNINEGYVKESASGPERSNSGGTCYSPGKCTNCNNGYYADGPYCRECPPIDNCYYTSCTNAVDGRCIYCKDVVKDDSMQYGWWAFSRWTDDGLSCKRACSWRAGSRCYPGACSDTTTATCQCAEGFTGTDCAAMTDNPDILQSFVRLKHVTEQSEELVEGPPDTSGASPQDTVWTNNVNLQSAEAYIDAQYVKELPALPDTPSEFYINKHHSLVGIMSGGVTLQLQREGSVIKNTFSCICPLSVPQPNNFRCGGNFTFDDNWFGSLPFKHRDTLTFTAFATNGGYITVFDREDNNTEVRYNMAGKTLTYTFDFGIDTEDPTHCIYDSACFEQPLAVPDVSLNASFLVTWDGWNDPVSGLKSYQLEVFHLRSTGSGYDSELVLGDKETNATHEVVTADISETTVTVPSPGPYSLTISAMDTAGNHKTARRVMVFDDQSSVELQGTRSTTSDIQGGCTWNSEPAAPLVTNADPDTNCDWINQPTTSVIIAWKHRFINVRHHAGQWLNSVASLNHVDEVFDDHDGAKQIRRTDNVLGIVRFEVAYNVTIDESEQQFAFLEIDDVHSERVIIDEEMMDGKMLNVTIRGYDITGAFIDDNVVTKADTSSPVIQNLWLTKGNHLNISIHNVEELEKITIEWEAYDYHSGVHEIYWRLYDNYTGEDVHHGLSYESPQGNTETLDDCKQTYSHSSRGDRCYCTPFDGCFHQHFQIKPLVVSDNTTGIISGKEIGSHDSDYFIEVTVTNRAMLTTSKTIKITIDTSPPVSGFVHDGISGSPELDFQQSKSVHVHWDGFFDKESGVFYYKYGYGTQCLSSDVFDTESPKELSITYNQYASFDVTSEDTYYVTVVAYNRALDHSVPVCSDGITIDTSVPMVKEVTVKGAKINHGILKTVDDTVWYLHYDRSIQAISNASDICRSSAKIITDAELITLPLKTDSLGKIKSLTNVVCDMSKAMHRDLLSTVSSAKDIEVSWYIKTPETNIHDFKVGLASTFSEEPDVVPFQSSHSHQHIRLLNPNLDEGEQFYIVVETVSKAEVTSKQVVGPFFVDSSPPNFQGDITLSYKSGYLVAQWNTDSFLDAEDENPLNTEFAVGTIPYGVDIHPFTPLKYGNGCTVTEQLLCTAVSIDELEWTLHGQHTYYMTIKATNTGGMSITGTSKPYVHDVIIPSKGVVMDIDETADAHVLDDIDFQTSLGEMKAKWYGFEREGIDVSYTACIAEEGTQDNITCTHVGDATEATISNLQLSYFKTYQFVIIARSNAGTTTVMSDGVTTIDSTMSLDDIGLFGGKPCGGESGSGVWKFSHHDQDIVGPCKHGISHQSSLNSLNMYWEIPVIYKAYTPDVYWYIQERAPVADYWTNVTARLHTSASANQMSTNYVLQSGRSYRFAVQFCADRVCFPEMYTNGVTVIHNPPSFGSVALQYSETALTIVVTIEKFHDSDIEDIRESREAVDHYEWAISDNGHSGKAVTIWSRVIDMKSVNSSHISFTIPLEKAIQFTNCWKVSVRGYNKAGLYSVVSREIRPCDDKAHVPDPTVIDAIGNIVLQDEIEVAESIKFEKNSHWLEPDKDYTPVTNMISALWPSLRYYIYQWALLEHISDDPILYYKEIPDIDLTEPCDLPEVIACGSTTDVYINVKLDPGQLVHGKRYIVCVHANSTLLHHEYWDEQLPDISVCSDGVTIDTSPPKPGTLWISEPNALYQSSLSDITVYWESFIDIEELRNAAHTTGIMKYEVAIGTHHGDVDVLDFKDVGVVNHITIHGLKLQNGHKYYATIKGCDFTGKETRSESAPIITDNTSPIKSDAAITIGTRHITDMNSFKPCWTGLFSDPESGINIYKWGIGSRAGFDDIFAYTDSVDECVQTELSTISPLQEGSMYFISVMAQNGAGFSTLATSWAFTVDFTPPNTGHVFDGVQQNRDDVTDQDYQTDRHSLFNYWSVFTDPHTQIQEYFIEVGTSRGSDNVILSRSTGLNTDVRIDRLQLTEGKTYYATVTACNTAGLCASTTSDGIKIDSRPPVPGKVNDGTETLDIHYQNSRTHVAAKWFGFVDPQSGISHYTWRVGTTPGGDDIVPARQIHRSTIAVIANTEETLGLLLPVGTPLYSTVRAYNKAGVWVESTSNGFTVDDTEPVILVPLSQVSLGSIVKLTSVLKTVLKFKWRIEDDQSFIERQYLSIMSHVGEDFNTSVEVYGLVRDFSLTNLNLHDGSLYDVTLISCNGARTCVKSTIDNILVDTTAPTTGTFAINTDHAASLDRQPDMSMVWSTSSVTLAWLGFSDEHSGVSYYTINVGSRYMGSELNQISKTANIVFHNESMGPNVDDGKVQVYTIPTQNLTGYQHLYIAIWAVNGVGLRSEIVHSQFVLIPGGAMELVRRCSSYSCQGHCVCAAQDRKCSLDSDSPPCVNVSGDAHFATVTVSDLIYLSGDPVTNKLDSYTPVNSMLSAKWNAVGQNKPKWYEWSVGLTKHDSPLGIFTSHMRIWHDAADSTELYYTIQNEQWLHDGVRYSVFIRAWYDGNSFADFKSPGVIIQSDHPETSNLFGKAIKEIGDNSDKDLDFVAVDTDISIDWNGKFKSSSEKIWKYQVYLSTYPGGHDLHVYDEDVPANTTKVKLVLQDLFLKPGIRYYTNVQAYNYASLHTTSISDGFVLDTDLPVMGMVLDGTVIHDLQYQNSSRLVSACWHGFSDLHSSVRSYRWCVSTADSVGVCNIVPLTDVGLKTHVTKGLEVEIENGKTIVSEVDALDGVGHTSNVTTSNGVVIDTTPPQRLSIDEIGPNVIQNPSFEISLNPTDLAQYVPTRNCNATEVEDWDIVGCCSAIVSSGDNAPNGKAFVWVRGSISQVISVLTPNTTYRLKFFASHLPSINNVLSTEEGFVECNGERHMFTVYSKPGHLDKGHSLTWQLFTYNFEAMDLSTTLTIGSFSESYGIALDMMSLQEVSHEINEEGASTHVDVSMVFVHDRSSVHASWKFEDLESGIKEYIWAIGSIKGGTQLQEFKNVGTRTFGTTSNIHLLHMSYIYVTVVATNGAGLKTVGYSEPIVVDLTPPEISSVNDGMTNGVDIDFQDSYLIATNFEVEDPESNIRVCYWAIGTYSGDISVLDFTEIPAGQRIASILLDESIDYTSRKLHTTVRCVNYAGLTATRASDGVHIIINKPSVDEVHIDVIEASDTQYPVFDHFHGKSDQLRIRWTGFKTIDWIDHYQVNIVGEGYTRSVTVRDQSPGYVYTTFDDVDFHNGLYEIAVVGVNMMDVESESVTANVTILTTKPQLDETKNVIMSWDIDKEEVIISWSGVFQSEHQLYYEVSVGKSVGNVDIIQWQETKHTQLVFKLSSSDVGQFGIHIYVTVRAISPSGMYNTVLAQQLVA